MYDHVIIAQLHCNSIAAIISQPQCDNRLIKMSCHSYFLLSNAGMEYSKIKIIWYYWSNNSRGLVLLKFRNTIKLFETMLKSPLNGYCVYYLCVWLAKSCHLSEVMSPGKHCVFLTRFSAIQSLNPFLLKFRPKLQTIYTVWKYCIYILDLLIPMLPWTYKAYMNEWFKSKAFFLLSLLCHI